MEPEISVTTLLKSQIETVSEKKDVDSAVKRELRDYLGKESIPFRLVKLVHDEISKSADKKIYLHELIQGSSLHLPEYKHPTRDPELEVRCKRLRAQQANKEYMRMVGNVDMQHKDHYSFGNDLKQMNRQLINVFNFVITVGGAFIFAFKAVEYSLGGLANTFALQLMAGLVFGTVVFFADLYFLIKNS